MSTCKYVQMQECFKKVQYKLKSSGGKCSPRILRQEAL